MLSYSTSVLPVGFHGSWYVRLRLGNSPFGDMWREWLSCHVAMCRNGNFEDFSGHLPRPVPNGMGIGTWKSGMGRVQVFFKKTRIGFGEGSGLVIIWPAPPRPEYEITTLSPPINLYFLFSFHVFFSHFRVLVPIDARVVPPTQCRNPSGNPFENPFNNLISSISSRFILVYPIFTRIITISSLMSLCYCHFRHRNHIFTYLQTGMIFCWFFCWMMPWFGVVVRF